ncbi:hypothetical protein D1155_08675 [Anaerotruncus sp. 80]|jgi:hypothetical protein|uniref:Uncharacterized protein n=1 Tax=Anaerotruncus colihominis TaxID=169435 RepID=A0A845QLW8_9FIRM|nr:hypothetical protein [Anaerotruncus colihominis]NCF02378.1 hypothetical protein [Anaerotruncus sp. 80]
MPCTVHLSTREKLQCLNETFSCFADFFNISFKKRKTPTAYDELLKKSVEKKDFIGSIPNKILLYIPKI